MSTPSLISRFSRWIDSLPYPARNIYLFMLAFAVIYALVSRAIAGVLPSGQWTVEDIYDLLSAPAIIVAILAIYSYLDRELSDALERSRTISSLEDEQFARFRAELTVVPWMPALIVSLLAGIAGIQGAIGVYGITSLQAQILPVLVEWVIVAIMTFGFAFSVIRLVVSISRFFAGPLNLSIYNVPPLYELPDVAAKGGLFLLLIWYSNVPFALEQNPESPEVLVTIIVIALIPLAAFLLPHAAVSRRLTREKTGLIVQVNQQLEQTFKTLEGQLNSGSYDNLQQLQVAIDTLNSERKFIESIPTWPLRLGTFRLALTAVILPVLVWVIQQVLNRFFP